MVVWMDWLATLDDLERRRTERASENWTYGHANSIKDRDFYRFNYLRRFYTDRGIAPWIFLEPESGLARFILLHTPHQVPQDEYY